MCYFKKDEDLAESYIKGIFFKSKKNKKLSPIKIIT